MLRDVTRNEKTEKARTFSNLSPRRDSLSGCPSRAKLGRLLLSPASRNKRDSPLGPHDQRSAVWITADGIERIPLLLLAADAMRVVGQVEVEDKIFADDEQPLGRNRLHPDLLPARF